MQRCRAPAAEYDLQSRGSERFERDRTRNYRSHDPGPGNQESYDDKARRSRRHAQCDCQQGCSDDERTDHDESSP